MELEDYDTSDSGDRPYRTLVEQMQEGAFTCTREGLLLYCNRRFAAMLRLPDERVIGAHLQRFLTPDSARALESMLASVPDGETSMELELALADGSAIPVKISLAELTARTSRSPVVCAVVTDLTVAARRAEELRASNERLRQEREDRTRAEGGWQIALEAAGMGSWELDLASGEMRRSLRHDQLFGYDSYQKRWDTTRELAHFLPEDRQSLKHALAEAKLTGILDIEARIHRAADRELRWLHIRGQTFYNGETPVRIAGVISDVTDRRQVEERLRQAQRIEALGQLTGGVAHDFNNLLQVIFSGLQVLGGTGEPGRRDRVIGAMKRAVEHGAGLCRQLLAFSRRQPLRPEPVDLKRLIGSMHEMLTRSLAGDVTVKTEFAQRLWPVEIDAGEMELVLLNLALNARDALPKGGVVIIKAYNVPALGDHELSGDYVRLDVVDQGIGMTPEVLAHAFEPFFTTKEVGKGSGLGLSQTHGFARSSGGAVRIRSTRGVGTTVSIYLPRSHRQPLAPAVAGEAHPETALNIANGQVLIVEDDDEVAALTVEMIHQLGYDTTRVSSAEAALGALADKRSVDIVFSDFMMPGSMNGVELAQEIRRRRPNLPILLTSGFAEAARRSVGAQQIRIISKPYRMDELREALRSARQESLQAS